MITIKSLTEKVRLRIAADDNPMCSETAVDRINDLLGIDE